MEQTNIRNASFDAQYRWVILILAYILMLVFSFSLQSIPPVLTLIIANLGLTHTQSGLLMSLFALPSIFLSVLAGLLSDRLGPFKVGILSLVLVVMGTSMFIMGGTFISAAFGRAITGIGASTIAIVSAQIISQWFGGHELGTAMGIYNTAMPVGSIVCFTTFGRLGERFGWRLPVAVSLMAGMVGLLAFTVLYKSRPNRESGDDAETKAGLWGFFSNIRTIGTPSWMIGVCWMWFNAAAISFFTFGPDFFISRGYSIGSAGLLVSFLMWGSLVLNPLIGMLVDRLHNNELFIGFGGILLSANIQLLNRTPLVYLPLFLLSAGVASVPSPVFSYPARVLQPEVMGLLYGVYFMLSSLGMFFGPYAAGIIRDSTGSYGKSFILLSIFGMLIPLTLILKRFLPGKDSPSHEEHW
jgi:MFS family permease